MTVCNMAIEAGARVGLVAVDSKTIDYCRDRQFVPGELFEKAVDYWRTLVSDSDAVFDKEVKINARYSATGHLGYISGNGGASHSYGAHH